MKKTHTMILAAIFFLTTSAYSQSPSMSGMGPHPAEDSLLLQIYFPSNGNLFPMQVTGTIGLYDQQPVFLDSIPYSIITSTADAFIVVKGLQPGLHYLLWFRLSNTDGFENSPLDFYTTGTAEISETLENLVNIHQVGSNIFISAPEEFLNVPVEIYNNIGQKVIEAKFKGTATQIDATNLPKGMYLVSLREGEIPVTKKVVIE